MLVFLFFSFLIVDWGVVVVVVVHLGEFGRSTASNLLDTEVGKVLLEFVELLGQVGLGLGPQFCCLDTGLENRGEKSVSISVFQLQISSPHRIEFPNARRRRIGEVGVPS